RAFGLPKYAELLGRMFEQKLRGPAPTLDVPKRGRPLGRAFALLWSGCQRWTCGLTYGFVDIVASPKAGAYTPAKVVGEAPPQICHPPAARGGVIGEPSPLPPPPPQHLHRARAATRR